jgi:hypothetical protein
LLLIRHYINDYELALVLGLFGVVALTIVLFMVLIFRLVRQGRRLDEIGSDLRGFETAEPSRKSENLERPRKMRRGSG